MKPKTMILMVVAIGCGLVASVMTSQLIADRNAGEPREKLVKVLAVKTKIKAFELIKEPEKFFFEKELPESAAPKKALRSMEEVKDKRPLRALNEDNIVTQDDLVGKDLNSLSVQLQPGTRAVAIRVNPESLAGGFVLPGSRVDVLHTLRRNGENSMTTTILQNMLVLAVDMNPTADPEKQAMLGNTVTLGARLEEAQRLTVASLSGELRLVLRPIGEDKSVSLKGSSVADLTRPLGESDDANASTEESAAPFSNLASLIPPLPPLPAPPEQKEPEKPAPVVRPEPVVKKHTLTLIQGDQVQKVTFLKGEKVEEEFQDEPTVQPPVPAKKPAVNNPGKPVSTPSVAPGTPAPVVGVEPGTRE